ncbi:MAG: hypothetical protein AB3N64_00315 [Puniceicoccaceae bacterium]
MSHKRTHFLVGILAFILLLALFLLWISFKERNHQNETQFAVHDPQKLTPQQDSSLFGDRILEGYGTDQIAPEEDIRRMGQLLWSYRQMAKGVDHSFFSANEDIAKLFTGDGVVGIQAISRDHPCLRNGKIVDRWDSPLLFHSISGSKIDIHSAGPDRTMGTEDDVSLAGQIIFKGKPSF